MTERERFFYSENRQIVRNRSGGACVHCGKSGDQAAHKVISSKRNIRNYGLRILNHHLNLDWTCAKCNQKSIVHGLEVNALIEEIREAL